jgi:hypothetical protein
MELPIKNILNNKNIFNLAEQLILVYSSNKLINIDNLDKLKKIKEKVQSRPSPRTETARTTSTRKVTERTVSPTKASTTKASTRKITEPTVSSRARSQSITKKKLIKVTNMKRQTAKNYIT